MAAKFEALRGARISHACKPLHAFVDFLPLPRNTRHGSGHFVFSTNASVSVCMKRSVSVSVRQGST
jgi:hypothetical protein